MKKIFLILIVALAFFLRTYKITSYPAGFNLDETSQGYTAYSLLKTGRDEWGTRLPLAPRAFGDYRSPLYTYLLVPSIAVLGLNELAIRLPAAVFGTLAVLVVYFLVKELFSDWRVALISALFLAISPWHISLSRGAFEASLHVFLFPLGMWLFFKGLKKWPLLILSAMVLGLNLFSYYAARFFTPMAVLILVAFYAKDFLKNQKNYLFIAILGIFLLISFKTLMAGGKTRVTDTSILNPTDHWLVLANRQYEAVWNGMPASLEKVFNNKATFTLAQGLKQYLSYFSLSYLFTQGASEATYGMVPGRGLLYFFELPLIILAVWKLVRSRDKKFLLILSLLLIAPFSAALAKGTGAANRAIPMLPLWSIISASGLMIVFDLIKKTINSKIIYFVFSLIIVFSLAWFLEDYFFHAPLLNAPSMSYGLKEVGEFLKENEEKYRTILVSKNVSEPQIALAYQLKIDPRLVQAQSDAWLEYERQGFLFVDQLPEYNLDKFVFRNFHFPEDSETPGVLFVGKEADFTGVNGKIEKVVYYPGPGNKIAYKIVSFEPQDKLQN